MIKRRPYWLMMSPNSLQILFLFGLVVAIFPLTVKVEYADRPGPAGVAKAYMDTNEMLNDDLIVSKGDGSECPDDDIDMGDCGGIQTRNKDALIYPAAKITTRKPLSTTRKSTPHPVNTKHGPGVINGGAGSGSQGKRKPAAKVDDPLCKTDDEDCIMSSGIEPSTLDPKQKSTSPVDDAAAPASQPAAIPDPPHPLSQLLPPTTPAATGHFDPNGPSQPGRGNTTDPDRQQPPNQAAVGASLPSVGATRNEDVIDSDTGYGGRTLTTTSVPQVFFNFKDNPYQLAINMNIILIIGIAAGIIILLLILIVAVCKYYNGRNSKSLSAAACSKSVDRGTAKSGYAYEACNTAPPPATSVSCLVQTSTVDQGKIKCSSPLLLQGPTSTVSITPSIGSGTNTKPVKKDVKEWYV